MSVCKQTPRKNVQLVNRSSENTAMWDFQAAVAKGKEEALEPSQQTGFQQPGFWITMVGFRIPLAGFRIPKPWIPDSTDQNYLSLLYSFLGVSLFRWNTVSSVWYWLHQHFLDNFRNLYCKIWNCFGFGLTVGCSQLEEGRGRRSSGATAKR